MYLHLARQLLTQTTRLNNARLVIVSWPSAHPYYVITSTLILRLVGIRPGLLMTVRCQLEPPGKVGTGLRTLNEHQ